MARWKAILIVVGIILMIYGGLLFAQTQQPSPTGGGTPAEKNPRMEHMIDMMFRYMDTDHDGKISKTEWKLQEKQFMLFDKNGDGFITRDEVRASMMERMITKQQQQKARPLNSSQTH